MKYPKYQMNEFVGGHYEFVTECPFGIMGRYSHEILMVGSLACRRCGYHRGINEKEGVVFCGIK